MQLIIPYLAYWKPVLEIFLLWYFIYMVFLFIKGTRTEQLLKGIIIIVAIIITTKQLGLETIEWVLTRLLPISVIALLIIFQPEMRRGLERLGQFGMHRGALEVIEEISRAALKLSKQKTGALIAIERQVGLKTYIETGVPIDSKVSEELITSIFMPQTVLHDGAIIIRSGRIVAAGCLLPLTPDMRGLSRSLGMRHRAAMGLSEDTDAVCVVVSEENGAISVSAGGKLTRNLDENNLVLVLRGLCYRPRPRRKWNEGPISRFLTKHV
ncbi:MAG: diadenylate cyclase CdaA [Candidatus Omnitrophica bacterium]|nr:diadenylate cyclase CdaA [Candidatus Omnitrophota bacterium]